ncbi:MAG: nucleotidyl transferase AbiEii/AbiGii toxin family protein [Anaerolineaceae bacterium]
MNNSIAPFPHGLLTPLQKSFMQVFAELPDKDQFYLTGGTALTEYYLGHRLSFDLDFFTGVDGLVLPVSYQIQEHVRNHGLVVEVVRRFATYVEFLVSQQDETLKIDLALDSPYRFDQPVLCAPGIYVNNFSDLCIDKLLAYFGRAEPRDAVDLFFILQSQSKETLLDRAAKKDPGFDLYWFAIALNRCIDFPDEAERWPVKMLAGWRPKEIKGFYQSWASLLLSNLQK